MVLIIYPDINDTADRTLQFTHFQRLTVRLAQNSKFEWVFQSHSPDFSSYLPPSRCLRGARGPSPAPAASPDLQVWDPADHRVLPFRSVWRRPEQFDQSGLQESLGLNWKTPSGEYQRSSCPVVFGEVGVVTRIRFCLAGGKKDHRQVMTSFPSSVRLLSPAAGASPGAVPAPVRPPRTLRFLDR